MDEQQIMLELKEFIESDILDSAVKLDPDSNFQIAGIDSFSIVEIILFIQNRYHLTIPDDQLKPENFSTLRHLARLVIQISA
jgi:acyl carrier protein